MVKRKKGWPMAASKMQFCTDVLKIQPANEWMDKIDPHKEAVCYVGIRREESKNRADFPQFTEKSEKHGGRELEAPLVLLKEESRNKLIQQAGLKILDHSSMECFPCVCSNRSDFRMLANYPERIELIAKTEKEMGFTSKGKPRVMFRPYRHMGATGIEQVIEWGKAERGKYKKPQEEIDKEDQVLACNSGFCGG